MVVYAKEQFSAHFRMQRVISVSELASTISYRQFITVHTNHNNTLIICSHQQFKVLAGTKITGEQYYLWQKVPIYERTKDCPKQKWHDYTAAYSSDQKQHREACPE